jgi:hypothetical protein
LQEEEDDVEIIKIELIASLRLEYKVYNVKLSVFLGRKLIYYSTIKSSAFLYKEYIN